MLKKRVTVCFYSETDFMIITRLNKKAGDYLGRVLEKYHRTKEGMNSLRMIHKHDGHEKVVKPPQKAQLSRKTQGSPEKVRVKSSLDVTDIFAECCGKIQAK